MSSRKLQEVDTKTLEQIKKASSLPKLETSLKLDFLKILKANGAGIDEVVCILAEGNPNPNPLGFRELASGFYSADITYRSLLTYLDDSNFERIGKKVEHELH